MPSQKHESRIFLFRNQPALAAKLLRDVHGLSLLEHRAVRIFSADITEVQPAEYRADMVVLLCGDDGEPVLGIIVEVQLQSHPPKKFAWPAYVACLRAKLKCPVSLLVLTPDDAVARWAAEPIALGPGSGYVTPHVIGPSDIPEVFDEEQARANPELAVLSAIAHGKDDDAERAARIALAAQKASFDLDDDRSKLYCALISISLGEAARAVLKTMDIQTFMQTYECQPEFTQPYVEKGMVQGELKGRVAMVLRLLAVRFGPVEAPARARIQQASIDELESIGERLLTAATLQEALG